MAPIVNWPSYLENYREGAKFLLMLSYLTLKRKGLWNDVAIGYPCLNFLLC